MRVARAPAPTKPSPPRESTPAAPTGAREVIARAEMAERPVSAVQPVRAAGAATPIAQDPAPAAQTRAPEVPDRGAQPVRVARASTPPASDSTSPPAMRSPEVIDASPYAGVPATPQPVSGRPPELVARATERPLGGGTTSSTPQVNERSGEPAARPGSAPVRVARAAAEPSTSGPMPAAAREQSVPPVDPTPSNSRTAAPAAPAPRLRLARAPAPVHSSPPPPRPAEPPARDPALTPAAAPAAAPAASRAERLAALTGGAIVDADDGRQSVVFNHNGAGSTQLARARETLAPQMPAPTLVEAPAAQGIDIEELYDDLLARLRRELLLDRERAGELP
jgi:hypothetical protein